MPHPDKILRLPEVQNAVGLRHSAIYALIAARDFPAPVQLTERARGWRESEILAWIESRRVA